MSPQDIRGQIWHELVRACNDRHHAWRMPVLATAGHDGMANARTVVLRHADRDRELLRVYTDRRSPKAGELAQDPRALFVFWSPRLSWQLRVRASVSVQDAGPEVEALWQRVRQSPAASDYLAPVAPGSPLARASGEPAAPHAGHHFAVLTAVVQEIDWLELARSGHRRARLRGDVWEWLTP